MLKDTALGVALRPPDRGIDCFTVPCCHCLHLCPCPALGLAEQRVASAEKASIIIRDGFRYNSHGTSLEKPYTVNVHVTYAAIFRRYAVSRAINVPFSEQSTALRHTIQGCLPTHTAGRLLMDKVEECLPMHTVEGSLPMHTAGCLLMDMVEGRLSTHAHCSRTSVYPCTRWKDVCLPIHTVEGRLSTHAHGGRTSVYPCTRWKDVCLPMHTVEGRLSTHAHGGRTSVYPYTRWKDVCLPMHTVEGRLSTHAHGGRTSVYPCTRWKDVCLPMHTVEGRLSTHAHGGRTSVYPCTL